MITNHDAELIARNDASRLHERDSKNYVSRNLFQYYTVINTWTAIVKPHNSIGADMLEKQIKSAGLLEVVARAAKAADAIVRTESVPDKVWALIVAGLSVEDALLVLRFPKRFTPVSDALSDQTLSAFIDNVNRMSRINMRQRGSGNRYIIECVRDEVASVLQYYEPADFSEINFTNGVSVDPNMCDTYHTYYEKLTHLRRPACYGVPYYSTGALPRITYPNGRPDYDVPSLGAVARVSTVPKSYKSYRTIAVETVDKQSDQQCVRAALEKALYISVGDHAPIHNQAINGLNAGQYRFATIDLHAASDSLSWWLMHEILPRNVFEDCMYARSAYIKLPDGRTRVNPLFCTMGNGFCFALETAVFISIIRAAVKSWCHFTGVIFEDDMCWAYGDDIIIIVEAYSYVTEWLTALDFIVNEDKSFGDGSAFRESCGFDWYDGHYVSSTYWPRAVIRENYDSLASLCALEARLFQRGGGIFYYEAYTFLINQIKRIAPHLPEVPLSEFLEYHLEGQALVSLTAPDPVRKVYRRDYGVKPGDGLAYEEERLYLPLLAEKTILGSVTGGMRVDTFLYYTFLKNGPKYEDELSKLLGVSTSYYDRALSLISDGAIITQRRLI